MSVTHTENYAQRRVDLETVVGVSPIYGSFNISNKTMVYTHGKYYATIDCHYKVCEFEQWFDVEVEACRKAFL